MGSRCRPLTATPATTSVWADSLPCRLTDAAPIGETEQPSCLHQHLLPPVVSSTSPYTEVRGQSREVSRVHVFTHIVCPVFIAVTLALRPSHTLKLIHPRTHLHLRPSHTQERHLLSVLAPRPSPSLVGPVSVWVSAPGSHSQIRPRQTQVLAEKLSASLRRGDKPPPQEVPAARAGRQAQRALP